MNLAIEERIGDIASSYVRKKPGALLTIGVLDHGQTHIFAFGENPIQTKVQSKDVIYEIGSISKLFTTSLLANLIHQRSMALEDPIAHYWQDIRSDCPITLKQLATHTSGLPSYRALRDIKIACSQNVQRDPYCQYSLEELRQLINRTTAIGKGKFRYSNVGMGLLGQLMAWHHRTSYAELLDRLIAKPLRMQDTFIALTNVNPDRVIQGHTSKGIPVGPLAMSDFQGAGAIRSTVSDQLRFLSAHMTAQEGSAFAMTHVPHVKITNKLSSGLGWMMDKEMLCHNGATTGFSSFMGMDKSAQAGVVVLSNYRNSLIQDTPDRIAYDVMAALTGRGRQQT
ncbi:beta-lactamase class C [Paenibacillus sp. UNCCL117]|uniref:serine hydrolase domain-containing protein n=1 Tax=unclassified Paenibacillus TaxID=185978 RepID=UPI000886CA76|nr:MULTISPECIES: serine hydrolase domain-containing protein [unclassified Paenibacillus]SDD17532.1 beta-lactamase class C [Paenibacillus sp. cl123]SFW34992.1 beta-lactamase class C [Paenibacillus sp. UNCCL117]